MRVTDINIKYIFNLAYETRKKNGTTTVEFFFLPLSRPSGFLFIILVDKSANVERPPQTEAYVYIYITYIYKLRPPISTLSLRPQVRPDRLCEYSLG